MVIRNKKGISVMIGYILLISMAIMMSIIVYNWVKTYVPQDSIECDDGVSVFIQGYNYECDKDTLNLNLKNNGRFNIAGYFIHVTTSETQELAVTDLSQFNSVSAKKGAGSVSYSRDSNPIGAGDTFSDSFNFASLSGCSDSDTGKCIYSVEIIPLRQEKIKNKNRAVSCTDARIQEPIQCGTVGNVCLVDGVKKSWEQCDCGTDGSCTAGELGGKTTCEEAFDTGWTGVLSCTNTCMFTGCNAPAAQVCGDGTKQTPNDDGQNEVCDLGAQNGVLGSGCTLTCQAEVIQIGQYYGFETDPQQWTVTSPDSDRSNSQNKVDDNGNVVSSGYSLHLRDDTSSSNIRKNINELSGGYISAEISFWYFPIGIDTGEFVQLFCGSTEIWRFTYGDHSQGNWFSVSKPISTSDCDFSTFPEIRFTGNPGLSNDDDNFYVDGINITGVKY